MPLSPNFLLILSDPDVYEVKDILNADETLVTMANKIICLHALRNVYYRKMTEDDIKDAVKDIVNTGPELPIEISKSIGDTRLIERIIKVNKPIPKEFNPFPLRKDLEQINEVRDPVIFELHRRYIEKIEKGELKASDWAKFFADEMEK